MNDWQEQLSAAIIQVIAVKNCSHKLNKQPIQDYKVSFSSRLELDAVQAIDGAGVALSAVEILFLLLPKQPLKKPAGLFFFFLFIWFFCI
jgi:ABC-type transport system involved in cytochrome bd biosynthesis fused ATPase/permease subunit